MTPSPPPSIQAVLKRESLIRNPRVGEKKRVAAQALKPYNYKTIVIDVGTVFPITHSI